MNSKVRKIVFFLSLLGISVVAFQFMIKPANASLAEQKARVERKTAKLSELKEATKQAEDLTARLEELREAMEFFESRLPSTGEVHKVLEQVTVIAQKQGLKPKTIRTLNHKSNSGYIEQPMKMSLVGNFTSFYTFLLEMEKLPRIMKIRDLKLEKSRDNEGQVEADFVVSVFFQGHAS